MRDELVRCHEPRDSILVRTFVLVVFGFVAETYRGCQYAASIVQKAKSGGDSPFQSSSFKVRPKVVQDRVAHKLSLIPASSAVGARDTNVIRIRTILAMSSLELKMLIALVMRVHAEIMLSFRFSSDETAAASSAPAV